MIEAIILVASTDPDTGVGSISLNDEMSTLLEQGVPITITPVIHDDGEGFRRVAQGVITPNVD